MKKKILVDASSAILLFKAGLFERLLNSYNFLDKHLTTYYKERFDEIGRNVLNGDNANINDLKGERNTWRI